MTASNSSIENSGAVKYGNAVLLSGAATLTPQSNNTRLFGVCKSIDERPTSLNPPMEVTLAQSFGYLLPWCIWRPSLCNNFFLSLLLFFKVVLILPITSELIGGVLNILGAQPVFLTIFLDVAPYLPITSPGFLAVITTSPVTVSK